MAPKGYQQAVYGVREEGDGTLSIGFSEGIAATIFTSDDF